MGWTFEANTELGPMLCRPLVAERFGDLEAVFGERGVARNCFCMHWRRPDGGYGDEQDNRDRFRDVAFDGPAPGLIGYIDEAPVGWVQVGPRSKFPTLDRSRLFKPIDDDDPWSINCFVVRTGHRSGGIGRGLLSAAIEYAMAEGAEVLEAYPVDGHRESVVDYFTGTLGMFAEHGFVEMIRRNETRPLVRLTIAGD
jgi:GNAT superfamily N-acetyltransferase